MRLSTRSLVLLVGYLVLGACQDPKPRPELTVGVSRCARCSAVIADKSWASADVGPSGETRLYDDPGCLVAARREGGGFDASLLFQDRGDSGAWLEAADAWFAKIPSLKSPQGYNWGVYASFADAQDAVTKAGGGRIVRFEQVVDLFESAGSGGKK